VTLQLARSVQSLQDLQLAAQKVSPTGGGGLNLPWTSKILQWFR